VTRRLARHLHTLSTMTIEYSDFLLTVMTLCALAFTVGATLRSVKLVATLSRLDRLADRLDALAPQVERLLVDAQDSLRSAEELTDRMREVADDAKVASRVAREDLVPLIRKLTATGSATADGLAHLGALVAATKAGFRVLGGNGR